MAVQPSYVNGSNLSSSNKRGLEEVESGASDDDDSTGNIGGRSVNSKKRNATSNGRKKVAISWIQDKAKRNVSFTKRKAGIMKKVRLFCFCFFDGRRPTLLVRLGADGCHIFL